MRAVLTLHGIGVFGGRGPWQKPIERVLAPHFRCITIKYSHYRWLGFLSAVVEPWLLISGIAVVLLLKRWYAIHFVGAWIVGICVLSCFAARLRHRMALSYFLAQSSHRLPLGLKPHVIAHSMGTKLVGTALKEYPQVRLGNVVLTGCVLPTNYPWRGVYQRQIHMDLRKFGMTWGAGISCHGLLIKDISWEYCAASECPDASDSTLRTIWSTLSAPRMFSVHDARPQPTLRPFTT